MDFYTDDGVALLAPELVEAAAIGDVVVAIFSTTGLPTRQVFLDEALGITGVIDAGDPARGPGDRTGMRGPRPDSAAPTRRQ